MMKILGRRVSLLLLFLMLSLLLIQSIPATLAQETKLGGTFIFALSGDPTHLNPGISGSMPITFTGMNIYNQLIQWGENVEPVPQLAESWTISEDGLAYTFNIVRNATWHDGKPLTSEDVKVSYEEVIIFHSSTGPILKTYLDSIETPDDYTVTFRLKTVFSPFMFVFGAPFGCVLPAHLYKGTDVLNNPHNNDPIGTGPFKFVEWVKGDHITLERNENYWKKDKPYLDRIVFKIIPESATRVLAMENHEIDYDLQWPSSAWQEVFSGVDIVKRNQFQALGLFLIFNLDHPILSDVRVRQAFRYAVDPDVVVQGATFGSWNRFKTHFHSGVSWVIKPDMDIYEDSPNVEKANQLLDEAGYPKGPDGVRFTVELMMLAGRYEHQKTGEVVRDQMKAVGVDVQLAPTEYATYFEIRDKEEFDMITSIMGTGPDLNIGAARLYVSYYFHAQLWNYNNSKVDQLFEQAVAEIDREKAKLLWYECQDILAEDMPMLPLLEQTWVVAYSQDFVGLPTCGSLEEPLDSVWWVKGEAILTPWEEWVQSYGLYVVVIAIVVVAVAVGLVFYRRRTAKA